MNAPTKIDDGGPAFPVAEDHKIAADLEWTCGMSLRDYFAAQVIGHLCTLGEGTALLSLAAKTSYVVADAMLAARKVPA